MGRHPNLSLERLSLLSSHDLKVEWVRRYGAPAPAISEQLLKMGLGYKLQEKRFGSLSRNTRSIVQGVVGRAPKCTARSAPRPLTPGTRLVRDWHGAGHTVTVLDDGFDYDGRRWKSLSAIAKAITGTKWNGPRFFGLTEKGK